MASTPQSAMAEALDRMWARFLPQIEQRIAVLEAAAQATASGTLTAAQREEAHAEAHKLAGVLGTFGLSRGTDLARELENFYSQPGNPNPEFASSLATSTAQLRTILAARK